MLSTDGCGMSFIPQNTLTHDVLCTRSRFRPAPFFIALPQLARSSRRTAHARCPSARRRHTHRHVLPEIGLVVRRGEVGGDFRIAHELIVDHHPLCAVFAPAFHLVHVDVVDEFPQDLVGQRPYLHVLEDSPLDHMNWSRNCEPHNSGAFHVSTFINALGTFCILKLLPGIHARIYNKAHNANCKR